MAKLPVTPVSLSKDVLSDLNSYNLVFSNDKISIKTYRAALARIHTDIELLLSVLPDSRTEELLEKLVALKNISVLKALTESRVRFWLNMMVPIIKDLAEKIQKFPI